MVTYWRRLSSGAVRSAPLLAATVVLQLITSLTALAMVSRDVATAAPGAIVPAESAPDLGGTSSAGRRSIAPVSPVSPPVPPQPGDAALVPGLPGDAPEGDRVGTGASAADREGGVAAAQSAAGVAAAPPAAARAPGHAAPPSAAEGSDSARIFADEFPAHAAATQGSGPASRKWAVLVGVNDHSGRTRDNIGSAQDAIALREALLARGWRDDHVLLLIDGDATHDRIVRGIEWLIRSTDTNSTVVFSFSGHVRQNDADPDRDGEALDEGLWASDNRFIWDADLSRMLGAVRSQRMWVTIQGCEAAGFNDAGMEAPGRVITYSSREDQKSFEDPEAGFSVQGNYLLFEPFHLGLGDADGDGRVSVQEAYRWATPRADIRTSGRQSPIMADTLGQPFFLD